MTQLSHHTSNFAGSMTSRSHLHQILFLSTLFGCPPTSCQHLWIVIFRESATRSKMNSQTFAQCDALVYCSQLLLVANVGTTILSKGNNVSENLFGLTYQSFSHTAMSLCGILCTSLLTPSNALFLSRNRINLVMGDKFSFNVQHMMMTACHFSLATLNLEILYSCTTQNCGCAPTLTFQRSLGSLRVFSGFSRIGVSQDTQCGQEEQRLLRLQVLLLKSFKQLEDGHQKNFKNIFAFTLLFCRQSFMTRLLDAPISAPSTLQFSFSPS